MPRDLDPWQRLSGAQAPRGATREDRVRLVGEAAEALLAGRLPAAPARLFLGGALLAWLENGGDLEGGYLRVLQRGSHRTPQRLWRFIADERRDEGPSAG